MDGYIVFDHVWKSFGQEVVLRDVCFSLDQGKIYGMLGRNGAGKTVIFKLLCGLLHPDKGEIYLQGENITHANRFCDCAGVLIESPGFIPHYSGLKNLQVLNDLSSQRLSKIQLQEAMMHVGLDPHNPKGVGTYSLGMTQKLGIAQALMHQPQLLILDEPMNGLDKASVVRLRQVLKDCRDKGTTIFLASHNSEDVAELCDARFIIDEGSVSVSRAEQVGP